MPGKWNAALNTYKKLIILRALTPDKFTSAVQRLIIETMSEYYILPPSFSLLIPYRDSNP